MKIPLRRFIFKVTDLNRGGLDQTEKGLTDDGGVLRPVQGADDDETEALVLFAVDDHVAGLRGGSGDGDHRQA